MAWRGRRRPVLKLKVFYYIAPAAGIVFNKRHIIIRKNSLHTQLRRDLFSYLSVGELMAFFLCKRILCHHIKHTGRYYIFPGVKSRKFLMHRIKIRNQLKLPSVYKFIQAELIVPGFIIYNPEIHLICTDADIASVYNSGKFKPAPVRRHLLAESLFKSMRHKIAPRNLISHGCKRCLGDLLYPVTHKPVSLSV